MLDNHFIIFMCATDNLASLIVEHCQHCRSKNKRLYIFFLLTTILTMIDNHFIIFMCTTDNLASPIVKHCQHCRSKNKRLYIFFLLTTILTMLDNHIYNIHVRNR